MTEEVDQFKEFDFVSFRGEDYLVLLAVEAHFKGDVFKGEVQDLTAFCNQFFTTFVVFVLIHDAAEFFFSPFKGFPGFGCALAEVFPELWKTKDITAALNEFLRITIAWSCL